MDFDGHESVELADVDVLVVGAGLAGCSLGLLMRREGRSVQVVELRDAYLKDKLCGGVLAHDAPKLFERIYGRNALPSLDAMRLDGVENILLEKRLVSPFSAAALPRRRLDGFCLNAYLAAGGELADRMSLRSIDERSHMAHFIDLRTRRTVKVRYGTLVGADGACSQVRRLTMGRISPISISVEGRVAMREKHVVAAFQPGYDGMCWYIPNGDDANVGCLFHGLSVSECRERLRCFCADEGYRPSTLRCAPIPTGEDVILEAGEDIWLVGDAAGLASKYDGGGMHLALASAFALSAALCGGRGYGDVMKPHLRNLARAAEKADSGYFMTAIRIAQLGSIRDIAYSSPS